MNAQIAQTAESVKRQQGTFPGKSVMNPRVENCNATELILTAPDKPTEIPPVRVYVPMVPYHIPPKHLMDPISAEQLAGFRKMVRRLPQKISFEHAWGIRPLHMFFKHCRETREEIKALFTEALTPSLKVLPKVDDHGKFAFPCSIAGVEFKEALCDSGSSVNLVSKAIVDELGIVDVEPSLKEFGDKSEIKEVLDGDPHIDTKKLSWNARVKEKFQKKRVKGDPTMTLIPRLCDEKSIEQKQSTRNEDKAGQCQQETTPPKSVPTFLMLSRENSSYCVVSTTSHCPHAFTQSSYRHRFSLDPPPCSYISRYLHGVMLLCSYFIHRHAASPLRR
ncbi:hypothetical protein F2Q68_00043858 [Brassica cretica]|uniref:Aspartic peptidase DDI1-type domain-containing protein n=2 Tax=Brassica cretica TaxID=69181 RepID=A0ABQ7ATG1_BRACR|nr:hypothetical protein F2Q68_00043858 [Brassica cretica]KAF3517420.1 hypothetical protein DY000_02059748 [Brassica cretica]